MAIYSGFSHKKLWFSIVMLVYQRVISEWCCLASANKRPAKTKKQSGPRHSQCHRIVPLHQRRLLWGSRDWWALLAVSSGMPHDAPKSNESNGCHPVFPIEIYWNNNFLGSPIYSWTKPYGSSSGCAWGIKKVPGSGPLFATNRWLKPTLGTLKFDAKD